MTDSVLLVLCVSAPSRVALLGMPRAAGVGQSLLVEVVLERFQTFLDD